MGHTEGNPIRVFPSQIKIQVNIKNMSDMCIINMIQPR